MRCSRCAYETPDKQIYCPSCGLRINESCKIAVIDGSKVWIRVDMPACDYLQKIVMEIDDGPASQPVELASGFIGGIRSFCFAYDRPRQEGTYKIRIYDQIRPFQVFIDELPVPFVQLVTPSIDLDKYLMINDGKLKIEVTCVSAELAGVINLYYGINQRAAVNAGPIVNGKTELLVSGWHNLGVSFEKSDLFETSLDLFYQLWDDTELRKFYSNNLFLVNRYRLKEISYVAPGLAPIRIETNDSFSAPTVHLTPIPIELYTYPNPHLNREWQKDKRYFKIKESFNELLNIAASSKREPELFKTELDYDRVALDLSVKRIEKLRTGDLILQINSAVEGRHRIDLVLSIGDINWPGGRFEVRLPIYLNVVTKYTSPLGLGFDFGTSRTMASVFYDDDNLHEVLGLDLDQYGDDLDDKMAMSVIPENKEIYQDTELGLLYPYICAKIEAGLKLYIKREIPKIMRNSRETTIPLREAIEFMFETLIGRITEHILQTRHCVPHISDICLGCPTIFDDSTIAQYAGFLKNVCLASPIQLSPQVSITVWDEVWAAFYHINSTYHLPPGHYLIWDMGGGTTDVVLVELKEDNGGSIPIRGFNSDCFGGKDVNEQLRRQILDASQKEPSDVGESDIESFKLNMAADPKAKLRSVSRLELCNGLRPFIEQRVGQIALGLTESMRRLGDIPSRITLIPIGGSSHLQLTGPNNSQSTLGDIIQRELEKLLPSTEIVIHKMQSPADARTMNRKACTSMGLSELTCNEAHRGVINRLPGLEGKCRFTIVRRNTAGSSEIVLRIGDPLDRDALHWLDSTVMFLVFGGSSIDENCNMPLIYGSRDGWEGFLANLFSPTLQAQET